MPYIRVKITRDKSNTIKTIDLEEYLRGVVPAEMYASWPAEALKAQTVAARTYAYKRILSEKAKDFDVDDTTNTQAYVPKKIALSTDQAVLETKGLILVYKNKPIDAVFTASNGGKTISAKSRWGNDISYLVSKIDSFDTEPAIKGHGVGLSQHGARNRALAGEGYRDILTFYYPGVSISQISNDKEDSMSTIRLANASIDEDGKIKGGKAGDQTGKEVTERDWYIHNKGWVMLRPIDPFKGLLMAKAARAACANPNIGYDQNQRNTLYNEAKKVGFDLSAVKAKCETDCSALVRVCAAYAGYTLPDFNTTTQANVMVNSGYFTRHTDAKYVTKPDFLMPGDVLVTKTKGHTVIVIDTKETESSSANKAQVVGGSVNVRTGPSTEYGVIAILRKNDLVTLTGEVEGNWYEIVKNGIKGWMSDKYLKLG